MEVVDFLLLCARPGEAVRTLCQDVDCNYTVRRL